MFLIVVLWLQQQAVRVLVGAKHLPMYMPQNLHSGKRVLRSTIGTVLLRQSLMQKAQLFLLKVQPMAQQAFLPTYGAVQWMGLMVLFQFLFLGSLMLIIVNKCQRVLKERLTKRN